MPLVFRTIKWNKWYQDWENLTWLQSGEIPGDPLSDLATSKGALSIYLVNDNRSDLDRVISAFAAGRDRPDNLDYILVNFQSLTDMGFSFAATLGITPDIEVNFLHRDIIHLTGDKLLALTKLLFQNGEKGRKSEKEIKALIEAGIAAGFLEQRKLKKTMKVALNLE